MFWAIIALCCVVAVAVTWGIWTDWEDF